MGGVGSGQRKPLTEHLRAGTFRHDRHAALVRPPRTTSAPRAPMGLSREARKLWRAVNERWELNDSETEVLKRALEHLARMRQAESELTVRGSLYYEDEKGQIREHPAVMTEHRARQAFLAAWKLLRLTENDVVQPPPTDEGDLD